MAIISFLISSLPFSLVPSLLSHLFHFSSFILFVFIFFFSLLAQLWFSYIPLKLSSSKNQTISQPFPIPIKASTEVNRAIMEKVNASGKIYITPATVHGRYFIRFSVGHPDNTEADIDYAWGVIRQYSSEFNSTNGES